MKLLAAAVIACSAAAFAAEPAPAPAPAPTVIKGNPTSKVYHKPACRHYNAKGSTAVFKSEADALKAGYQPCKQCAAPKKSDSPEKETAPAATQATKQNTGKAEKAP
jgi:methylphosphotriester-DNA--protein-cysteine methyltransferase